MAGITHNRTVTSGYKIQVNYRWQDIFSFKKFAGFFREIRIE